MLFKQQQTNPLTYLSPTSEFHGTLNVEGNLRVDGIVHGTVEVRGDLEVSRSGLIEGPELRAKNILVQGVVKARVIAEGRLTLTRSARLEGDVTARSLDIEVGAFYTGHIATSDTASEVKALPISGMYSELLGREDSPSASPGLQ